MTGEFLTNHEIIAAAHRNADSNVWDYVSGGAESETALRRNRLGLDCLAFRPRVLRDVSGVDTSTTLLGHKMRVPVLLAPMASLQIVTGDGATAVDAAAEEFGTLNMVSSRTEPALEEVAANSPHAKFFQLYVRGDKGWTRDMLDRVKGSGFKALALTVDSAAYGNRERQVLAGWLPPGRRNRGGTEYQTALSWDSVDELAAMSGLPMILKGIATAEDAGRAMEHQVAAIYISNHGGRQLDHGKATIEVLPEIAAVVDGRADIIIDGGFMRGTDVIKALALGATSAAMGKLQAWALAAGGSAALVNCLEILEQEITVALGLLGVTSVAQLNESYLCAAEPVTQAQEMSAFPHLRGGWN